MQNDSYNNRIEQDIARCKQDFLKAVGQQNESSQPKNSKSAPRVMPVFEDILKNKVAQAHPPVQSTGSLVGAEPAAARKEFVSRMVEKISRPQQQDRSSEMPSLDLGSQILAQQRKVAGLKRKSPLQNNNSDGDLQQKAQPQKMPVNSMPSAPASPQQLIIADIVAREIMSLSAAR
jgi:hypothetical protein